MIVTYKLNKDAVLSDEELKMLEAAEKMPVVYDDDCPKLTPEMEKAFIAARKANPIKKNLA
jgi:hypothetical protein